MMESSESGQQVEPATRPQESPAPFLRSAKLRLVAGRVVLGGLLAYTLSVFIAWATAIPDSELESSWYMVLHWAFLKKADFGNDIIFTFGPLGFLFQGFHPQTFGYTVITWGCIGAVWFVSLLRLGEPLKAPRVAKWLGMAGLIALVGSGFQMMGDVRLFVACWSLVLIHFFVDPRPLSALKIAIVVMMAAVSLGKFSLAIVAFISMLTVTADLIQRRKPPWLMVIWIAAMGLFWLLAGQRVSSVIPYLRHAIDISAGYAQAEGSWSDHDTRDVLLYLSAAGLFMAATAFCQIKEVAALWGADRSWKDRPIREAGIRALLIVAGLALALFLFFKMGYVRHDGHEIVATSGMAALAILYSIAQWPRAHERVARGLLIAAPLCCLPLAWFSYHVWERTGMLQYLTSTVTTASGQTWTTLRAMAGDQALQRRYTAMLASFREHRPLPAVQGTMDGFSFVQRSILAHDLQYHPRPVFQGYLAFTPALAELNANRFRGDTAPKWVVFDPQQIDSLSPTMLDAPVWPEVFGRYRLNQVVSGGVLLERLDQPAAVSRVLVSQRDGKLGEWIDMPAHQNPLWAEISLRQTISGRVMEVLYKPPPMAIDLKMADPSEVRWSLLPRMAGQGFLVSPMIASPDSYTLFFSDRLMEHLKDEIVLRMRVVPEFSESSTYAYGTEYELRLYELRYPRRDISSVPGFAEMMRTRWMEKNFWTLSDAAPPKRVYDANGKSVLLSPPRSLFMVDVPAGARSVRIAFGMLPERYKGYTMDPVEFRVHAASRSAGGLGVTPLWARRLVPTLVPADQGVQAVEIPFPSPAPPQIILETSQGASPSAGGSYWAGLEFR